MAAVLGVAQEEEDEACLNLCPLFEYRLVSHESPRVQLDFGGGVQVDVWQDLASHRAVDASAPENCPTEHTTRTGAVVWDAAVALAALLVSRGLDADPSAEKRKRGGSPRPWGSLLELGAGGHGLCGAAALLSGACSSAVFTDRPALLPQLEENLARNLGGAAGSPCWAARSLLWGTPGACAAAAAALQLELFDVVVAAD